MQQTAKQPVYLFRVRTGAQAVSGWPVWSEGEKNHPGALLLAKSILSFSLRIKFREKCNQSKEL